MLSELDQSKLLLFWYKNPLQGDFSAVAYRNVRLPFGLRCSPTLLLLGLYKILVLDAEGDEPRLHDLKKQIYHHCYMVNCAFTAQDSNSLVWGYEHLQDIISPYGFKIQQSITNDEILQNHINQIEGRETTGDAKLPRVIWNRKEDSLSTKAINLNKDAETKRKILSSIASQYDLLNYNGPVMNRARMLLHQLQMKHEIGWDEVPSNECLR